MAVGRGSIYNERKDTDLTSLFSFDLVLTSIFLSCDQNFSPLLRFEWSAKKKCFNVEETHYVKLKTKLNRCCIFYKNFGSNYCTCSETATKKSGRDR